MRELIAGVNFGKPVRFELLSLEHRSLRFRTMKASVLKVGRLRNALAGCRNIHGGIRRGSPQLAGKGVGVIGAPFGMGQVSFKSNELKLFLSQIVGIFLLCMDMRIELPKICMDSCLLHTPQPHLIFSPMTE